MSAAPTSPLETAKPARAGLGCAIPFGLLFAGIGLTVFWLVSLSPILRARASTDWVETPCRIISSKLDSYSGSEGTTYRVAVRYRYTYEGRDYESDRFDFSTGRTNVGVKRMRAVVKAHPPGHRTVCFVDPADPGSAVIDRSVPGVVWFGFFTLIFPVFGIGFIVFSWRSARKQRELARSPLAVSSATVSPSGHEDDIVPGETLLKPSSGRVGAFLGVTFFAFFWNGIVGVFVFHAVKEFGKGFIGWFLPIFLIPFVVVGVVMLGSALQAFSRLFAPAVEVRLDPSRLRLGSRVPFTWRLRGRGVRKLAIRLVAREEVTYRQGTRTTIDKSDFLRATVFESTDRLALAEGRAELTLPDESVAPAFAAKNNKLVWELVFDGEIPWRADVADRFELPVRGPQTSAPASAAPEPRAHEGGGLALWTIDHFAPGETLVFTLARVAAASTDIGPLTVQLGWFTEGRGTTDAGVVWSEQISALSGERSFEVRLPAAPWSFSGKLLSVSWRLEVLDAKRAPLVAVPLVVAPGGAPAALPALEPEPSAFQKRKARYLARNK
jgi:Protein of unknown function (DUF3592).